MSFKARASLYLPILALSLLGLVTSLTACISGDDAHDEVTAEDNAAASSCGYGPCVDGGTADGSPDGGDGGEGGLNLRKSFAVTDQAVLTGFSFERVMNQIATTAGTSVTGSDLYRQWWDTQRTAANGLTNGPHCDDAQTGGAASHNGFAWQCPRNEGALATTNPFDPRGADFVFPIGLFNRFDLAPTNGANCGEHRIVFGKTGSRNLIIFEAVVPNPRPSCGIDACRPVAELWAGLSSPGLTVDQVRARLEQFYFVGLPGFEPVVHVRHYGPAGGQIRSNQFMPGASGQLWNLKEFKLATVCSKTGACTLQIQPVTDKTNPGSQLFSDSTTDPRKADFQAEFASTMVPDLAGSNVNAIGMRVSDKYNSGQSQSQSFDTGLTSPTITNDYSLIFNPGGPFAGAIQARLTQIGSPLTPSQIVARATTQSCGGCHQFSSGRPLGGGMSFPGSQGFTHVQEFGSEGGGFGPAFPISSALKTVFLPHRKSVTERFLARRPIVCKRQPIAVEIAIATELGNSPEREPNIGGTLSVH